MCEDDYLTNAWLEDELASGTTKHLWDHDLHRMRLRGSDLQKTQGSEAVHHAQWLERISVSVVIERTLGQRLEESE